jgi:hypothetical protein
MELPANFQVLDEGTQDYIRDLLRQLTEAHRDLDRAQTDQVVVRDQLTNADIKVASKLSGHVSFSDFLQSFCSNLFFSQTWSRRSRPSWTPPESPLTRRT